MSDLCTGKPSGPCVDTGMAMEFYGDTIVLERVVQRVRVGYRDHPVARVVQDQGRCSHRCRVGGCSRSSIRVETP
jgi:hypothetical protein